VPIFIQPNPSGSGPGPGIVIAWTSDFIGPLPSDSTWHIELDGSGGAERSWIIADKPTGGSHGGTFTPFVPEATTTQIALAGNEIASGQSTIVSVQLRSSTSVLDSGSTTGAWNTTTGLPIVLENMQTTTVTGFTSSDRTQLNLAVANSALQIPIDAVGGLVNAGLGRLVRDLPPYVMRRHGSVHLSGSGSLNRGTEPFASYSLGIEWLFDLPPAGFGRTAGVVEEWERRMVQFQPVFETPLHETYWDNLVDARENGQRMVWGTFTPRVLNYFCAPGVGVTVWFLVFNALP